MESKPFTSQFSIAKEGGGSLSRVRETIRLGGVAQYFETGPCLRARIYHTQERTNARSEKTPGREISIGFFQRISHVISISRRYELSS